MNFLKTNQIFKVFAVMAGLSVSSLHAESLLDQLIIDGAEGGQRTGRKIQEYDSSVSKFDGSADASNPYIGVMHRTFDCGFSPERDHSLFTKRIREGKELYERQGVTEFSNSYNLFRTAAEFLNGGSISGGQPVIAMGLKEKQIFLIYRIYETKDGRATLLCYYNSEGKIGSGNRSFDERLFTLKGYKMRNGFKITEGSATDKVLTIGLIDPTDKLESENSYTDTITGVKRAKDKTDSVGSVLGTDDWETNPPHPDNVGVSDGQVAKKVESKSDIFQTILDPLMFGAKIGVGAYMLKEVFKKDKKKDKDEDEQWDYGYGMDYGGYGSMYGNGFIMGGGNMYGGMYPGGMYPGMYPGMMPGMMPGGMLTTGGYPYQQVGYPGSYPGTMPSGTYPGSMPVQGGYTQPMPGDYPGSMPVQGGYTDPSMGGNYPGSMPFGNMQPTTGYNGMTGYNNGSYTGGSTYPVTGAGNYSPLPSYTPTGTDPNMYPLPNNTAPLAPSSSTGSGYNLGSQIQMNDNTFLSTSGL